MSYSKFQFYKTNFYIILHIVFSPAKCIPSFLFTHRSQKETEDKSKKTHYAQLK